MVTPGCEYTYQKILSFGLFGSLVCCMRAFRVRASCLRVFVFSIFLLFCFFVFYLIVLRVLCVRGLSVCMLRE